MKLLLLVLLFLSFPYTEAIASPGCAALTGQWQGAYAQESGPFDLSTPLPVIFNIVYNSNSHIIYGQANIPIIPNTDAAKGRSAHIIGYCEKGAIHSLLFYLDKPTCGHYQTPGGQLLTPHALALYLSYEFPMIDADFTVLLHKTNRPPNIQETPLTTLPKIKSCH